MPRLETDLELLETKLGELTALRTRVLKGVEVEALAECAFRIAVHLSTPTVRAAELLQLAMRSDPANPKYPYHLARLYFRDGDFPRAGDWLNRARKLCPTSHRIWTHIGLLQREVNEVNNRRYREQKDYNQDEHKQRWKDISDAIVKGSDQLTLDLARFEPELTKKPAATTQPDGKPAAPAAGAPPASDEPEEAAERLTNAGVCRWTRIFDLIAEDQLESVPGARNRDAVREIMERAAAGADSRPGGQALFCILAIEWVLRGYSPAFIRRIRPQPRQRSAGAALLDLVLGMLEAPADTLPAALASALAGNTIPPVLAAAIHRQFVFGPPLDCGKLIADLRGSRAVARGASPDDCATWLRTLTEDAAILEPKPFAPVADFPVDESPRESSPEEVLAACTSVLDRTLDDVKNFRRLLDERKSKPLDAISQDEILDANRIRAFLAALAAATQKALGDLKRLRDAGNVQAFADAIQHLENGWQNLNVRPLILLTARYPMGDVPVSGDAPAPPAEVSASSAPAASSPAEELRASTAEIEALRHSMTNSRSRLQGMQKNRPPADQLDAAIRETRELLDVADRRGSFILAGVKTLRDSAKLDETLVPLADQLEQAVQDLQPLVGPLRNLLRKLGPAPAASPADQLAPDSPVPPQDPKSGLAALIENLEQSLVGRFDAQLATVGAYSSAQSVEPALQAIRMSVTARKADALYRLGKRREARREWALLLKEDIFDLRLLRNLAIADTVEGDVQRYLSSWRNYVEMLYFQAAAMRDVSHLSGERESFHNNYGNAYGLKNLYEEKSGSEAPKPVDPADLQAFISSPARVRAYIRHQLLAIFNSRLSFRTIPLVLGVTRSAAEPAREEARRKMEAWSAASCALLPARAAKRFCAAVSDSLTSASEGMKSNKRLRDLAGSEAYQQEKDKYLKWIVDVFSWKIRLHRFVDGLPEFSGQPGFVDLLAEFAEVDSIPLDTSEELLQPVALKYGQPSVILCSLVERTCSSSLVGVLQFVFPKGAVGDSASEPQRRAIYTRLTTELGNSRLVSKSAQIIDDPGDVEVLEFYPPEIQAAIKSRESPPDHVVQFLGRLNEQYPVSGGIAYHYAMVLVHAEKLAEAKKVAAAAASTAFHEATRKACQELFDQIRNAGG